jgi:hypothetical protein
MALQNLQQYGCQTGNKLKEKSFMRQVQPETLPKNSNFSSCLKNIKVKNNTT